MSKEGFFIVASLQLGLPLRVLKLPERAHDASVARIDYTWADLALTNLAQSKGYHIMLSLVCALMTECCVKATPANVPEIPEAELRRCCHDGGGWAYARACCLAFVPMASTFGANLLRVLLVCAILAGIAQTKRTRRGLMDRFLLLHMALVPVCWRRRRVGVVSLLRALWGYCGVRVCGCFFGWVSVGPGGWRWLWSCCCEGIGESFLINSSPLS